MLWGGDKLKNRDIALMLLGLIPGMLLFTFNIIGFKFEYFPGDLGDGRFNLYFLEHAHKFFTGKLSSFWNAPFIYPETNVTAYSDNLLGSAPIYSIFRLLGLDIYLSYQLWFVVVSALNYITCFYFLKYVFRSNYSAVLGAFIFAFSLSLQSQIIHAQTIPRFAIPIAFLMAVKFGEELQPKYFFYTLLFVVYQIYCGIYLGFMLAVPIGIYLILSFLKVVQYEKKIVIHSKWILRVVTYCILNIIILLSLMLPYIERKISPSFEHFKRISYSIPTIKSYFYSKEGSLFWDFLSKTGENHEMWWNHQIFSGGIATICLLIGIYWLLSATIKIKFRINELSTPMLLLLTGVITFFLYLSINDISAYIVLYYLPGFNSMRSMTRIINIELIFFAISTTFVFAKLLELKVKHQWLIFFVALLLIICDNYFYENKMNKTKVSLAKERTAKIESLFAKIPSNSVVSYEPLILESASTYYHIDAMLAAQKFNLKTINGYTGRCPDDIRWYWDELNEASRNYWLKGKILNQDILYIIKGEDIVEKVSINKELQNFDLKSVLKERFQNIIEDIRNNKRWMKKIEKEALKRHISVDSMMILDAKWILKRDK
ncbi:MAG: hypothetical protein JKY33_03200 [Bacteroidia bacterium]|nr:hypothetical protein [Bacteroidia bacterium]